MSKVDIEKVTETLTQTDEATIREIVRQAEVFLAAQLQAGLASDLRAMTLAAILAAILSFLVGGTASLLAAKIDLGLHIITIAELLAFIGVALGCAVCAALPTKFDYAGSNPRFWTTDVEKKYDFVRSMASQAAQYADGIVQNGGVLERAHIWIGRALFWVVLGLTIALAIEFVLLMTQLAKTGSLFASVPQICD